MNTLPLLSIDVNNSTTQSISNESFVKKRFELNFVRQSFTEPNGRKKHYVVRGILIGGAIGILPVVFGEGGAYVSIITFPAGLITGAILGLKAKRKHRTS